MTSTSSTDTKYCSNELIPFIDISMFDESTDAENMMTTAQQVYTACTTSGFFFLKPRQEVQDLILRLMEAVRRFFALPLAEKERLNNDETTSFRIQNQVIPGTGTGYRGFGLDHNFNKDTRESYNFGNEDVTLNKYPREDIIGVDWFEYLRDYKNGLLRTSVILRRLIALALGQDMTVFGRQGYFDSSMWLVGMVHYSDVRSNPEAGIYSIRPHSDLGMFTLLVTDGQPGLQICLDKTLPLEARTWIDVPPEPSGHFTVNVGKCLEILSNGIFNATNHRVVNVTGKERYSSPFFYETNIDTVLAPFPECCVDFPAKYEPTTLGKLALKRVIATSEEFE